MASVSKSHRTKVLHVLDRSIPNLSGYSIRSKYIVEFQSRIGLSPAVITSPGYDNPNAVENINDISYYRSYSAPSGLDRMVQKVPFVRELKAMVRLEKAVSNVVDDLKIDIIHAHSPSLCGIPALRVAKRKGIPFVYEIRAFWEDAAVDRKRFAEKSLKYRVSKEIEQRLFRGADAVVCICSGLKKEIASRTHHHNIHVVPNGVDSEIFTPRDKALPLIEKYKLQNKVVVGFIGSFFTFEGLSDLIKSVPKVISRQKNVSFLIVGGGVEDSNVKKLAAEMGILDDSVIFTGRVPHEQIQDYYSIMDVLVYPRISKRITELVTPLKPLEAMAMERAVLASDVGGLKELVTDNKTGVLFKSGDIDDLAEKLIEMSRDEKKRRIIGENARAEARINREWSTISRRYLDIYKTITSL